MEPPGRQTEPMTDYTEDYAEEAPVRQHRVRYDPNRRGGEAAYRAAQRHSALVRTLRIALPAVAVAGIAVFWASAHFVPGDVADLVQKAGIDVKSNSVVMNTPHISGFEGTRRAYEVKAARAIQSLDDPKVLTFEEINAHIGLDEAGTATVNAGTGIYNGNNNTLELKNGVSVETTTGYAATIKGAAVDLAKGSMTTSEPVEISGKEGSLHANSMEVTDRGKFVAFRGGVSLTFMPPAELATPPEAE
jgi:lipopolysaccharide export system protein LptC